MVATYNFGSVYDTFDSDESDFPNCFPYFSVKIYVVHTVNSEIFTRFYFRETS